MPYPLRSRTCAAAMLVPDPIKQSKMTSPTSEKALTKNSTRARGNGAEWEPCPLSDLASITLLGRANPANRPCSSDCRVFCMAAPVADCSAAIAPRLPEPSNPEPLVDVGLSGEYSKQSSDRWLTAAALNLIVSSLVK